MTFALAARAFIPAGIETMAGNPAGAEQELLAGYEALEAIGETELRSTVAASLAENVRVRGPRRRGRGVQPDQRGRSQRATTSARRSSGGERGRGHSPGATAIRPRRRSPAKASALAATTDCLSLHGDALLDLAETLTFLGGAAETPQLLTEATALFEQKEDLASLRRVARVASASETAATR